MPPHEPASWDAAAFQKVVNDFLDRRGWSQNELSRQMSVSQTAVNRWLQPTRATRPQYEQIVNLARLMQYPTEDLMRLCGYTYSASRRTANDPALTSLLAMIESAYKQTDDPVARQNGITGITGIVQSFWRGHPRRRSSRPRSQPPDQPESLVKLSYAISTL